MHSHPTRFRVTVAEALRDLVELLCHRGAAPA